MKISIFVVLGGLLSFSATAFADTRLEDLVTLPTVSSSLVRLKAAVTEINSAPELREITARQENALAVSDRISGNAGIETTKFQHYFKGLEVVGSMAFHHLTRNGAKVRDAVARFDLSVAPALTAETAASIARATVGARALTAVPQLKIFPNDDMSARLVYWVSLDQQGSLPGHDVIVDAHSGDVIADLETVFTIAPVQVYNPVGLETRVDTSTIDDAKEFIEQHKNDCEVIDTDDGSPLMMNPKACKQVVRNSIALQGADVAARNALANSRAVLSYYKLSHGRDSYDNRGAEVVNIVHVGDNFDNAFWNSQQKFMGYGSGDPTASNDFTAALDVAAHELTHAVTSQTAALVYMGESGALNEAYSDFFGIVVSKTTDWILGKKIFKDPTKAAKGIRNLAQPGLNSYSLRNGMRGQYPDNARNKLTTAMPCGRTNDNCFVHINSTIPGHASYLIHKAIGGQKAEALYYQVLTQRLTPRSNFAWAASETIQACNDMYDDATCKAVSDAFDQTGMNL